MNPIYLNLIAGERRKPKKQKTGAPASVKIKNNCKRAVGLKIGKDTFKIPAGKSTEGKTLSPSESTAYEYNFAKCRENFARKL